MDQVIKQAWLTALRSGEYEQATAVLHSEVDGGFCCLGVLCDLAYKEGVVSRKLSFNHEYYEYGENENDGTLPREVLNWAGLGDGNPEVAVRLDPDDDEGLTALSELNDAEEWDFNQIADVIEEQF